MNIVASLLQADSKIVKYKTSKRRTPYDRQELILRAGHNAKILKETNLQDGTTELEVELSHPSDAARFLQSANSSCSE